MCKARRKPSKSRHHVHPDFQNRDCRVRWPASRSEGNAYITTSSTLRSLFFKHPPLQFGNTQNLILPIYGCLPLQNIQTQETCESRDKKEVEDDSMLSQFFQNSNDVLYGQPGNPPVSHVKDAHLLDRFSLLQTYLSVLGTKVEYDGAMAVSAFPKIPRSRYRAETVFQNFPWFW